MKQFFPPTDKVTEYCLSISTVVRNRELQKSGAFYNFSSTNVNFKDLQP